MTALQRNAQGLYDWLCYLAQVIWAVNPRVDPPPVLEHLAGEVQDVLPLVSPPDAFRRRLGSNLALAAQRRMSGIAIENARTHRDRLLFSVLGGLLATLAALLCFLLYSRLSAER